MAGVNSKNNRKKASAIIKTASDTEFSQEASGQPPSFQAKGKGYFNRLPDFPATARNANAVLENKATKSDTLNKIYMFVDRFHTGWAVAGEMAQTHTSRTFYPRHLSQDDLVIEGQVANQYEYDRLVRFTMHSQNRVLDATDYTGTDFLATDFSMFKPQRAHTIDHFRPFKYKVAIINMEAGHERFKNAPAFTLTCKVLFDYTRGQEDVVRILDLKRDYHQIFGDYANPIPFVDNAGGETNAITVQKKPKPKNPYNDPKSTKRG